MSRTTSPTWRPQAPMRDTARAAFLAVTRALGELRAEAGDVDGAVHVWMRLVDADPYDEDGACAWWSC